MKSYTTKQGDTWDSIAYKLYGDVKYTDVLMRANIKHHQIFIFSAGVELVIPEVDKTASGATLPPWKQVTG